eukprot:4702-Heterococcus_DN1.PRE.1
MAAHSSYRGFEVDRIGAASAVIMQSCQPSTNLFKRAAHRLHSSSGGTRGPRAHVSSKSSCTCLSGAVEQTSSLPQLHKTKLWKLPPAGEVERCGTSTRPSQPLEAIEWDCGARRHFLTSAALHGPLPTSPDTCTASRSASTATHLYKRPVDATSQKSLASSKESSIKRKLLTADPHDMHQDWVLEDHKQHKTCVSRRCLHKYGEPYIHLLGVSSDDTKSSIISGGHMSHLFGQATGVTLCLRRFDLCLTYMTA